MSNFLALRHLQRLPRHSVMSTGANIRSFFAKPDEIEIPKRIPRGPTDILKALAATVGRDPTAAHYKYHDDPFLIPGSNIGKRSFAMAQESGRKAARWIRQTDREWFNHIVADPPIEAFLPQIVYDENSKVTEDDLKDTIANVQVADAILVYDLLVKSGQPLSDATKMDFLQLLCFFNTEDTLDEEWLEERWFRQGIQGAQSRRKTWKDGALAEQIFNDMETKTAEAYCTIIRGMTKYFQVQKAFALYEEALDKGLAIDTNTFNSLISVSNFLKEGPELRWECVVNFLNTMKERGIAPNLGTLNACLHICSTLQHGKMGRANALSTLAEFKSIGIEPSLASWYYILITFCRERGPVSHVLSDIMNEIQGKSFEIQDPKDIFFFVRAMDVCNNHLGDKHLAKRVDELLHTANNYNLIGDAYKESIYYRHYMRLMCLEEPLDVFMELYNRLVPNIYTPEPGIMAEVLKAVEREGAIEQIPLMWSHMIIFDYANRENMLAIVIRVMLENEPHPELASHANLQQQLNTVTTEIWDKLNDFREMRPEHFKWSGSTMGDLLVLACRGELFELAERIFNQIDKSENEMIGEPRPEAFERFAEFCVARKKPTLAVNCLQFCIDNGYPEARKIAQNLMENLTLDEFQAAKVKHLMGQSMPK